MLTVSRIVTERTVLTLLQRYEYQVLIDYGKNTLSHLSPWEPEKEQDYFDESQVRSRLQMSNDLFVTGSAIHFVARGNIDRDG